MNSKQSNLMWIKATGPPRVPYLHPPEAPPDKTSLSRKSPPVKGLSTNQHVREQIPPPVRSAEFMWIKATGPPKHVPYLHPPRAPPYQNPETRRIPPAKPESSTRSIKDSSTPMSRAHPYQNPVTRRIPPAKPESSTGSMKDSSAPMSNTSNASDLPHLEFPRYE